MRPLLLVVLLAVAGCASDSDGGGAAETSTTSTVAELSVDAVANALLTDTGNSPLQADPSAGEPEARCLAERLIADFGEDTLRRAGLPEDLSGLTALLDDEESIRRFASALFDCLDMRSFIAGELTQLEPEQAACVAELVVVDEEVRLLFLIGTRKGSPTPPTDEYADELARLDAYIAQCETG